MPALTAESVELLEDIFNVDVEILLGWLCSGCYVADWNAGWLFAVCRKQGSCKRPFTLF